MRVKAECSAGQFIALGADKDIRRSVYLENYREPPESETRAYAHSVVINGKGFGTSR